jgi:hypothetical protein
LGENDFDILLLDTPSWEMLEARAKAVSSGGKRLVQFRFLYTFGGFAAPVLIARKGMPEPYSAVLACYL